MTLDPTVLPLLRAWPTVMRRLVDTAPEAARTEADDSWTAKDVIAHLADVQMWGYADRIAHMLTRKSPTFQGYAEAQRLDESGILTHG